MSFILRTLFAAALLVGSVSAQYRTETWNLDSGWNGLYLNVDPGLETLDTLLAGDLAITEVWQWRPTGLDPRLDSPDTTGVGEWKVWRRGDPANSTFSSFAPNTGYYVYTTGATAFSLKGKVLMPETTWRTDGANLLGFPIAGPSQKLSDYLASSGLVTGSTQVFRLVGGEFSRTNPQRLSANLIQAKRGEAIWIRSNSFSYFYGPVSAEVPLDSGLHFGASGSFKRLVLRNHTDAAITVTLAPVLAESAPGQATAPSAPPLLVHEPGSDPSNITLTPLGAGTTVTVPAQDSAGINLCVDRTALPSNPDNEFASLLKVTDGGGQSELYLPVTALETGHSGLWIGEAHITKVQNQLQRFQRDAEGNNLVGPDGNYIPEVELDGGGNPVAVTDQGLNSTAQAFKLRLIVHVDATGQATLLSRAYAGVISDDGAGNTLNGITTVQSRLHPDHLEDAVRISASHFPTNLVQSLSGALTPGGTLTTTIPLGANHPSNPFLHTYHPDHDNKDARFANTLPAGTESHSVNRNLTMTINAAASPSEGPQWGSTLLSGTFAETITGIHKETIATSGSFGLAKISDIATLQTP